MPVLWLLVLIMYFWHLPERAMGQTSGEVRAWIEQEAALAREFPQLGNKSLKLEQRFHARLDAAALNALRLDVQDKPDHPGRAKLIIETRRLRSGPDAYELVIWATGPGSWRFNKTPLGDYGAFVDHAAVGTAAWQLTPDFLGIVTAASPPPSRDFLGNESAIRKHLDTVLHGGLGFRPRNDSIPSISSLEAGSGKWTAVLEGQSKGGARLAIEVVGTWDVAHQRGFVRRRTLIASHVESAVGSAIIIPSWSKPPDFDSWIATQADYVDPNGRVTESLHYVGAAWFTSSEFDALTRIPDPLGVDPVRGSLTVRSFSDFRPTKDQHLLVKEGRLEPVVLPSRQDRLARFRTYGWIAIVLIAVFLVGKRLIKHTSGLARASR
jgi:hypothetical protein